MRFKIDENLPLEVADILSHSGYEAVTASQQGLSRRSDAALMDVCTREKRALVTLDMDFSDIRTYPPEEFQGIIVLRATDHSKWSLIELVQQTVALLERESLVGRLWIVEPGRIRIRGGEE